VVCRASSNSSKPQAPRNRQRSAEIDGVVRFGDVVRVSARSTSPETTVRAWYSLPRGIPRQRAGRRASSRRRTVDGRSAPTRHDILAVLGEQELARYLVNEIQEVSVCRVCHLR